MESKVDWSKSPISRKGLMRILFRAELQAKGVWSLLSYDWLSLFICEISIWTTLDKTIIVIEFKSLVFKAVVTLPMRNGNSKSLLKNIQVCILVFCFCVVYVQFWSKQKSGHWTKVYFHLPNSRFHWLLLVLFQEPAQDLTLYSLWENNVLTIFVKKIVLF